MNVIRTRYRLKDDGWSPVGISGCVSNEETSRFLIMPITFMPISPASWVQSEVRNLSGE